MRKKYVPFAHAESIFVVEEAFYKANGIKVVLCDLDNTLGSVKEKEPSERVFDLIKRMNSWGIRFLICSNNTGGRVERFASKLGIQVASRMMKPLSFRVKAFLKKEGIDPKETLLVGDQIMTDVLCGNGAGIKVLLTEPISTIDPPWTRFNRIFDKPKRKKLLTRHLVPEWEECL
ncbi:MAG: HAD-IIIA family hydrolase [Bacilli bacterium]|nr:HAD-IIIA family hydrolase [Bacilli bacterium]